MMVFILHFPSTEFPHLVTYENSRSPTISQVE